MTEYKFYMQKFPQETTDGNGIVTRTNMPIFDLERDFVGLYYNSLAGCEDYGKPTNIYIENFPETEEASVYIPDVVVLESTDLTLSLHFLNDNNRETYHDFINYISGAKVFYWDNVRNRKVAMFQNEKIKPEKDLLYGSSPYIDVSIPFKNIYGRTFELDYDFSNLKQ